MARKPKVEEVIKEETSSDSKLPEYDLYAIYQEHFKQQQHYFDAQNKKVLEYWTAVLNNLWWWKK